MLKCTSVIILSFILNALYAGTNINLEKVQGEGLTNYNIKCIQQDAKGFLWFGTEEGVFKYDGYTFKAFKNFPGDTNSLINNDIEFLFPEHDLLWVGSRGGLSCIDINTNKIRNFSTNEPLKVYSVLPKNDSVFWIGTSTGLFQFNKKTSSWKRISALGKGVFIRSICDDGKHHLYIATHNGFYCFDAKTETCKHFLLPNSSVDNTFQIIHRCLSGNDGNIWMTSWHAGLIQFNPATGKIKNWFTENLDSHQIYKTAFDILQTDNKNIWIANESGGLTIFNCETNSSINYPVEWDNEKKLSDAVTALFRDRSGIIWVGTENGIYKYDPHILHLSKVNLLWKMDTGLTRTQLVPLCMLKDKEGLWWVGTYEGIFLFDSATGILHDYTAQLGIPKHLLVTNIIEDSSGTIWVTSFNMLISFKKKPDGKNFSLQKETYKSPAIKSVIYKLYIDHESRMWMGTHSSGIFMFDPASKKFIAYPYSDAKVASNENEVRCFYELSKDSLLTGGENTGLLLLHTDGGRYEKIQFNSNVAQLASNLTVNEIIKKENSLWITTDGNGLWQTDEHFQKVRRYTTQDGLPSMNISPILEDKRNHLWLLTQGGVVDFQPQTIK